MASSTDHKRDWFWARWAGVEALLNNPGQHAAVFCVDEKTAIQALDRLDPVLPLSPGRLERHGFEYRRDAPGVFMSPTGEAAARHRIEYVRLLEVPGTQSTRPAASFRNSTLLSKSSYTAE